MDARKTTIREYVGQRHIRIILAILLIVVTLAVSSSVKRIKEQQEIAKKDTLTACRLFVEDEKLCKFAAQTEKDVNNNQVVTERISSGPIVGKNVIRYENSKKFELVIYSGNQETNRIIAYKNDVYALDPEDKLYAFIKNDENDNDESLEDEEVLGKMFDFTYEYSEDVKDFNNNYDYQNEEECGKYNCYKYSYVEIDENENVQTTFLWFDDKEFRLRKKEIQGSGISQTLSIEYKEIKISRPINTKEVSESAFGKLIGIEEDGDENTADILDSLGL